MTEYKTVADYLPIRILDAIAERSDNRSGTIARDLERLYTLYRHELRDIPLKMKKYYRVHWRDCPEFSPKNAESFVWGTRGQETFCPRCNGQGYLPSGRECPECGGTGVVEVRPREGYSCCESPAALYKYFNSGGRDEPADNELVVEFSGRVVGYGFDNEPLVIPDMEHVRWMTWAELRELARQQMQEEDA